MRLKEEKGKRFRKEKGSEDGKKGYAMVRREGRKVRQIAKVKDELRGKERRTIGTSL